MSKTNTMKKLLFSLSLVALVAIGIVGLVWIVRMRWQPRLITEITQESISGGPGAFPSHKVILRPHQSTYIGDLYDPMRGTWKSADVDFGFCERVLRQSGFFSFRDDYTDYVRDVGTETLSAAYPGGRKTVEEYGGSGPKRLEDLQTQIENAVAKAHWHKVSSSTTYPADD